MEYFHIEGGHRLGGTITPAGNKNAALPLMAASLLTHEPLHLHNIPNIGDVRTKVALPQRAGGRFPPEPRRALHPPCLHCRR